jgi:hypothetical protein
VAQDDEISAAVEYSPEQMKLSVLQFNLFHPLRWLDHDSMVIDSNPQAGIK